MALLCEQPTEPVPLPERDHVGLLVELHARTVGVVEAFAKLDAKLPMLAAVTADVERTGQAFTSLYAEEHEAASKLVTMIAADVQRGADHEAAVRVALASGQAPPTAGDAGLIQKIIGEQRAARVAAYPVLESLAADYTAAAFAAARSRALLLALKLRPIVGGYQKTIDALREAEARASGADEASLLRAFQEEGLLKERATP